MSAGMLDSQFPLFELLDIHQILSTLDTVRFIGEFGGQINFVVIAAKVPSH